MKMNRAKFWKKAVLGLAVIVIGLAVLASGRTAAYFTVEETAYNVITTGYLYMDLVEETTGGKPWPEEGITGVVPGMSADKVVYVENKGGVPFFTRISMDKLVLAGDGKTELSSEFITVDLNEEQWLEKDGYYYYHRILEPGEKTEPLFTLVKFGPELGNEYMTARVEIQVLAQAVQSANNGEDPLEAQGWSASGKLVVESVDDAAAEE